MQTIVRSKVNKYIKVSIQKPFECISWKRYTALWLQGKYEELGEECLRPWNCKSCESKLKRVRFEYRLSRRFK